jgi:formyltetrahydrofolate-dependent phosphoribosylglycinamide formyltransferase
MFKRLKEKWNVGWLQFALIFCTFALGGSACAKVGSWLLSFILTEKSVLYWIIYVPLITILWPICVLLISIFLGQFSFFKNYLHRIWGKINGTIEAPTQTASHQIAIFASGAGSNAQKIIEHFANHPSIKVALIVCNKPSAGVLSIAKKNQIPTLLINREVFFSGKAYVNELKSAKIDFIVLAGFLWKVPSPLIHSYLGKIVNIHPALLPNYGGKGMYGHFVYEAVIASGDEESGITIHFVDEAYDHGSTIFQARCEVLKTDTPDSLAKRIHELEHTYYPAIIEKTILQDFSR